MKTRQLEEGVELTPDIFLISKVKICIKDGDAIGYTSRVGPSHVGMLDLDVKPGCAFRGGHDAFLNAILDGCGSVALLRTDRGNYHILTLDVLTFEETMRDIVMIADMVPPSLSVDYRHYALGILQGYWTLRLSSKNYKKDGDIHGVDLVAYAVNDEYSAPWSLAHHVLLENIAGESLPRPNGTPLDAGVLDIVRYAV